MIRGTTPTFIIHITGDGLIAATPYVTIRQGQTELTRSGAELITEQDEKSCTLSLTLSQEEPLKFQRGMAEIQVRWVYGDGAAWATTVKTVQIEPILLNEVIEYATT